MVFIVLQPSVVKQKKENNCFPCLDVLLFNTFFNMVEPLLSGIVLGLIPVTLAGLFVTAYLQYRRGDRVTSSL